MGFSAPVGPKADRSSHIRGKGREERRISDEHLGRLRDLESRLRDLESELAEAELLLKEAIGIVRPDWRERVRAFIRRRDGRARNCHESGAMTESASPSHT
jgi:hypothetical protein